MNDNNVKTGEKKPNKFFEFIKRNKMSTFLFIVLLVVIIWSLIRVNNVRNDSERQISNINSVLEQKIDSIKNLSIKQTVTTLSWAIRSELTRQNMEQVDQYFMNFVRQPESDVLKLYLIDPSNNTVTLSTDKKDEGSIFEDRNLTTDQILIKNEGSIIRAISPIMGLNNKLAILVIDYKNNL